MALLGRLGLAAAEPPENLARGKPYVLEPAPAYPHCTDDGDLTQLTDGQTVEGYFWTQPGTVGWSAALPATITIDMGEVVPIGGLSFHTAAGVAGVSFPAAIWVLASEDGKAWRLLGDLASSSSAEDPPPSQGYAVHTFRSSTLTGRGRLVKLLVDSSPYIFVDEIEVYRGAPDLLDGPPRGREVGDPLAFFREGRATTFLRRRIRADLAAVEGSLKAATLEESARGELADELRAIAAALPEVDAGPAESFTTVFPIVDLHRRVFAVQGRLWREAGLPPILLWQTSPWNPLSPTEPPRRSLPGFGAAIEVALMRGEFRCAAFNVSRAAQGERGLAVRRDPRNALRLSIRGLPGGTNPGWVSVREVEFTDTLSGTPVAAALPEARRDGESYVIDASPGLTRQVWLTFHPTDVPAGEHVGKVEVEGTDGVHLRVRVFPIDFPARPALHVGGWDYTDRDACYEVTPENRTAFIEHLRSRFVDTPWAQSAVLPTGKHDAEGRLVEPPSTAELEKWLLRWPDARNYYVFAAVGETFAGFALEAPPFRTAVGAWIRWWADHLRAKGIDPRRLGLLLVDEPRAPEHDRIVIAYARAIRAAEPEVTIFEDPIWSEPWKADPGLFDASHALCPNLPMWIDGGKPFADFYEKERASGKRLWFYSCSGPGKLLDPYAYHRLQPWFCWRHGAEGSAFWAFGDSNGAPSWNEYAASVGAYTPLFLDRATVTAGKHMEAIREGVEDYEYLRMLRDRTNELEKAGADAAVLDPARKLLAEGPSRVIGFFSSSKLGYWSEPKDRSGADRVRVEILECLERLRS